MSDQGPTPPPAAPPKTAPRGSVVQYKAELRKAIRRNAIEPEINFLNITAMLDIMTIILVFLLKSLGESSAAIPQSDDLRLPNSFVRTPPHQEGIIVTISTVLTDDGSTSTPGTTVLVWLHDW